MNRPETVHFIWSDVAVTIADTSLTLGVNGPLHPYTRYPLQLNQIIVQGDFNVQLTLYTLN